MKNWGLWVLGVFWVAFIIVGIVIGANTRSNTLIHQIYEANEYTIEVEMDEDFLMFEEGMKMHGNGYMMIEDEFEIIIIALDGAHMIGVDIIIDENGNYTIGEAFHIDGDTGEITWLRPDTEVYIEGNMQNCYYDDLKFLFEERD